MVEALKSLLWVSRSTGVVLQPWQRRLYLHAAIPDAPPIAFLRARRGGLTTVAHFLRQHGGRVASARLAG